LGFLVGLNLLLPSYFHTNSYAHTTSNAQAASTSYSEKYSKADIVGQNLVIAIPGTKFDAEVEDLLYKVRPAGVVLFDSNIESEFQTQQLTSNLQKWANENDLPPLFICVDQEGGVVQRIEFDMVRYSQPQLGALDKKQLTQNSALEIVNSLTSLGVNVNFAPVVDVAYGTDSIMQLRSFGNSPEDVSRHLIWQSEIYNKSPQVLHTLKHFPGHGRTTIDSHKEVPIINIDKDKWLKSDAVPFRTGIEQNVRLIMTGHIKYPRIDDEIASQSEVWIQDILRKELGYDGLVITDDIKMNAVKKSNFEAAKESLEAGNDLVIAALSPAETIKLHENLMNYYKSRNLNSKKVYFWRFVKIAYVKASLNI
jgi:beta-N-acetylhexosaminidase